MDTPQPGTPPLNTDDRSHDKMQRHDGNADAAFNHPKALSEPIGMIERLLTRGDNPGEGIRQLCERAIANPGALIEAASNYLAHVLSGGRLHLCQHIPSPYLVEEMVQGALIISPLVISYWEKTGDSPRLLRLADNLIYQAPRLKGVNVGGFILELAIGLALQKPVRSMRLIETIHRLEERSDEDPLVCEARRWQAAGDFLRADGQMFRKFWQKLLKEEKPPDWESEEAAEAVRHLKKAEDEGKVLPPLLLDAIPPVVWSSSNLGKADQNNHGGSKPQSPFIGGKSRTACEGFWKPDDVEEQAKARFLPFALMGGLAALMVAAWIWRDSIWRPWMSPGMVASGRSTMAPPAVIAKPKLVAERPQSRVEAPSNVSGAPGERKETPSSVPSKPEARPAPFVAMIIPAENSLPPPASPQTSVPALPAPDGDAWRKAEFAAVARQNPSVVRWHALARTARWREVQSLLMGLKSFLPYQGEEYPHLLTLLLLEPPADADVAEAVPKIAARRMKTAEFITLWEKLVYPGSPNEKQIRAAAEAYLSVKSNLLTPSVQERLQKLARPSAKPPSHE